MILQQMQYVLSGGTCTANSINANATNCFSYTDMEGPFLIGGGLTANIFFVAGMVLILGIPHLVTCFVQSANC